MPTEATEGRSESAANLRLGCGNAKGANAFEAGATAARRALADLEARDLSAVLVFASVQYDLNELLAGIHEVVGEAPVLGATTAGEICNGSEKGSVVVVALASPHLKVRVGVGHGVSRDWRQALAQALSTPEVKPFFSPQDDTAWMELTRQGKSAFGMLFVPGNTRFADSRSFELLEELKNLSQGRLPVIGGAAADDWRMEANYILWGRQAFTDSILVAIFETRLRFGLALDHGFGPTAQRTTVTRAEGREVLELDGQRAADRYCQLLQTHREALEGRHLTLATGQPLGIFGGYGQYRLTVASYFTPRGGVRLAQPPEEGTVLAVMEGHPDNLIVAGQAAARKALLRGQIRDPALVLVFSSALRTFLLGGRLDEEIAAIQDLLPNTPVAGFYSFGEQGQADDGSLRPNHAAIAVLALGRTITHGARVALENERLRLELEERGSALKASEEQYRLLVKSIPAVVFKGYADWSVNFFDDKIEELTGYPKADFDSRRLKWRDVVFPEDLPVLKQAAKRALETDGRYVREYRIRHKGGEIRWLQGRGTIIRDAAGKIDYISGVFFDITARKEAEEALRESEERYSSLFEKNHAIMLLIDPATGAIVDANPAACSFYGYAREELKAKQISDINTLPRDQIFQKMQQAKSEAQRVFYFHHRLAGGQMRDVEVYSGPIQVHGKELLFSIVHDITERHKAEKARRESEERFRILVDQSFDGIFVHENFRIFDVNQRMADISGYSRTELLGMKALDLFTPDSQKSIREYVRFGKKDYYELELRNKDGRIVPVESFGSPCKFHGRDARIVALRDISERKRAEADIRTYQEHLEKLVAERTAALTRLNEQLLEKIEEHRRARQALGESERRIRKIFEESPIGIGLRDLEGYFLEGNPALQRIWGYSWEELRRKNLADIIHPEDEPQRQRLLQELLEGRRNFYAAEFRFFHRDGSLRWCHSHVSLIHDENHRPAYSLAMLQDITREKQVEAELAQYQENLRSLASELSLTEERERRRLAEFLHDDIGQNLALAKIKLGGLKEALASDPIVHQVSEVKEFLEQTIQSTRNLTFELSLPILYEMGLEEAVEWLVEQFQSQHGITISVSRDAHPTPLSEGARVLLFRMVRELLTNIVKHARASRAEISFQRQGGYLNIRLQDNGIGFDAKPQTSSAANAGGFGLFSVRERLSRLGGLMEVQSTPGKGAQITIVVPLHQTDEFPPAW